MLGRITWTDYTVDDELGVLVRASARMEDESKFNGYVKGTEPYIFAPEDEEVPDKDYIQYTEGGYESLFDHDLQKVVTDTPKQAGGLTDNFSWTGEGDVPYYRRVAIHDGLSGYVDIPETEEEYEGLPLVDISEIDVEPDFNDVIHPRISIADIEVHVPEEDSFDEMTENGSEPINVITSYDTLEEEYTVFFCDKYNSLKDQKIRSYMKSQLKGTEIEEYIDADIELRYSDSEVDMLKGYIEYVDTRDFDLESGWNYVSFDRKYIRTRMNTLHEEGEDIHPSWLSPFGEVSKSYDEHRKIVGRPPFDQLKAFCDKLSFSNWRSKSLEYVSNEELGIGKIDDVNINEDWENNPSKLIAYNIVDTLLCVALDDKNDIHGFFYEMANACSIPITDVFYEKRQVDGLLLADRADDEILPTTEETDDINNAGGYVSDAANGRIENVGVSDLKSLYPSAMITWNISTETLSDSPDNFDEYIKVPKVPEPKDVMGSIEEDNINMDWMYASYDEEGILPRNVKRLFKKRNREKEEMYSSEEGTAEYDKWDRKQGATKVLMNSVYGVSASPYWRLSNQYLGDAITSTARYTLWKGKQTLDRLNYSHVYSDSVTGDRNVVVKSPNGEIRCIRLKELWGKSSLVYSGEKDYAGLVGWKALSVSDDMEVEWKEITSVIRHEVDKDIVELQQSKGSSITTKDHSYIIEEEGELVESRPSEVKEPLRVNIPDSNNKSCVKLDEYVDDFSRMANSLGRGTNMVEKKLREEDGELFYGEKKDVGRKRTKFIINEVSGKNLKSLMRLCGAYISDGSASTDKTTSSGKWGLSFSNEDHEWLEQLESDYHNLFRNVDTCIVESDSNDVREVEGYSYNDETFKLQCMNRLSAVIFDGLCGSTSERKKLPDFAFNLEREYKEVLIEALIKGDGSRKFPRYNEEYRERNFTYTTKSSELCSGISTLLNQIDQKHFFSYREEKKTYSIRTADRYDGRAEDSTTIKRDGYDYVYDLSVEDNNNFVDAMGGVLLHNTDSHMLKLSDNSIEEQVEELKEVSEEMDNDASSILSDCGYEKVHPFLEGSGLHGDEYTCMHWEAEKCVTHLQLNRKKRYAQAVYWKEGNFYDTPKISISGFENARSDSPEITAELQEEVIRKVLFGAGFEEVSEYIQSIIEQIDEDHPEVEKFALPGSINKDLEDYPNRQIPRACMWSNEHLDKEFSEGDDPFVYMVDKTPSGLPNTDVVALEWNEEIPEGFELDKEAIIRRGVRKPIESIIEEMNWTFDEIRSGKKQKSMDFGGGNPFS